MGHAAPQTAGAVPGNALVNGESKRAAKRRRGRERDARRRAESLAIVERVLAGETYADIAADMGRSESTIRERFLRTMERTATNRELARVEALMRLERLQYQLWEDATSEEDAGPAFVRAHRAMRQLRWILDQKHRIEGLYEPVAPAKLIPSPQPELTAAELDELFKGIQRPRAGEGAPE
jgi:predicted transcriptional regulator